MKNRVKVPLQLQNARISGVKSPNFREITSLKCSTRIRVISDRDKEDLPCKNKER